MGNNDMYLPVMGNYGVKAVWPSASSHYSVVV